MQKFVSMFVWIFLLHHATTAELIRLKEVRQLIPRITIQSTFYLTFEKNIRFWKNLIEQKWKQERVQFHEILWKPEFNTGGISFSLL